MLDKDQVEVHLFLLLLAHILDFLVDLLKVYINDLHSELGKVGNEDHLLFVSYKRCLSPLWWLLLSDLVFLGH